MLICGFARTFHKLFWGSETPASVPVCFPFRAQPSHVLLLARAASPPLLRFPSHSLCHQNPQGPACCGAGGAAEFHPSAACIPHPRLVGTALIRLTKHTEINGQLFPERGREEESLHRSRLVAELPRSCSLCCCPCSLVLSALQSAEKRKGRWICQTNKNYWVLCSLQPAGSWWFML